MSKAMEPDLQTPLGRASGPTAKESGKEWNHPSDHWLRGFVLDNRAALGTLAVFIVMMAIFMIANPTVFTTWYLYSSVLTTLPVALFVVVPLVFVVTCGEIGAVTVSFIQTGVVAAGLSGFYVQFFNGLIIILSLLGHKWNQRGISERLFSAPTT